jgi:hypothetical protein
MPMVPASPPSKTMVSDVADAVEFTAEYKVRLTIETGL